MSNLTRSLLVIAACGHASGEAALVTDWRTYRPAVTNANSTTVMTGETTNNPVIGSLVDSNANNVADNTAQTARIIGYFSPQSLTNVGDQITLTFSVVFADLVGTTSGQDNFRFALFDRNGEGIDVTLNTAGNGSTNTDDLRGYIVGVDSGTANPQGSVRERVNSSNVDPFAAGTAAGLTGSNTGSDVTLDDGPTYTGTLTLTLSAVGTVGIAATFNGSGGANTFATTDSATPFTTFAAVGFLNGSGISTDQVSLQNVEVNFTAAVPEASSVLLVGLVGGVWRVAAAWRRRGR